MVSYFKCLNPDGTDPLFNHVPWVGEVTSDDPLEASKYATQNFLWPCRLVEVEPLVEPWDVDAPWQGDAVESEGWRVVRECEPWEFFGPRGKDVLEVIQLAGRLTKTQAKHMSEAWSPEWSKGDDAVANAA